MLARRTPAKLVGGLTMGGGTIAAAGGAGADAEGTGVGAIGEAEVAADGDEVPPDARSSGALRLDDRPVGAKDTLPRPATVLLRVVTPLADGGGGSAAEGDGALA